MLPTVTAASRPRCPQPRIPAIAAVAAPFERDIDACIGRIGRWLRTARARGADLAARLAVAERRAAEREADRLETWMTRVLDEAAASSLRAHDEDDMALASD
jgi:hypothetical protein